MEKAKTNRKYKDSVFTKLFSEKGKLLELYNAIENTNYGEDTEIQIATLENVLFMGQANDIAFVVDGKLVVLIEHQSTINYNMPLRMLIYMSKTYEKLTNPDDLYLKKRMTIPKPEFIVLYNGDEDMPDEQILKLSDMYPFPCDDYPNTLNLSVKVININKGRNEELASRSETLNGYEYFVYLVKEYSKTLDRNSAIERAIDDCIRQDVLKRFLELHSYEVRNMLLTEWNMKDALRVEREEALKEGVGIGRVGGLEEAFTLWESGMSLPEAKQKLGL
ncbi:MAG: hypothetical protein FWH22_00105 [Fibromonadales bacterium]|nr:hypothetical protein [Fibromonadales bacterium]